MKRIIAISTALFLMSTSMCGFAGSPLVTVKSYHLSQKQINEYSIEAMDGSGDAAVKLCDNFFFDRYDSQGNPVVTGALPWAIVGAENGNAEAQFRAFQLLSASDDKLLQARAIFWLKKAAGQNYLGAKAILKSCPSIHSAYGNGKPCYGPESR